MLDFLRLIYNISFILPLLVIFFRFKSKELSTTRISLLFLFLISIVFEFVTLYMSLNSIPNLNIINFFQFISPFIAMTIIFSCFKDKISFLIKIATYLTFILIYYLFYGLKISSKNYISEYELISSFVIIIYCLFKVYFGIIEPKKIVENDTEFKIVISFFIYFSLGVVLTSFQEYIFDSKKMIEYLTFLIPIFMVNKIFFNFLISRIIWISK